MKVLLFISLLLCTFVTSFSQDVDTALSVTKIPKGYIQSIDNKIDKYNNSIIKKTNKTLTKLIRWENKIHKLLQKTSPATAEKLFGNGQMTFSALQQKLKSGEDLTNQYVGKYDEYNDKLSTSLQYIAQQKDQLDSNLVEPILATNKKMQALTKEEQKQQAIQQFIKERKKLLLSEATAHLKHTKYLSKISKETWYYAETMKQYKEIFKDPTKAEQVATDILNQLPAFQQFMRQNSQLASLFKMPGDAGAIDLTGLQTRAGMESLIQERISTGGPNAQQEITQRIQQAKSALNELKDKVNDAGGGGSDLEMPDFKPNMEKTKTFLQRLEYGTNLQFAKNNNYVPGAADIALNVAYKINEKSQVGIGASYKVGLGTIEHINFTHQGVGLRSFAEWKLKKQLYVTSGFEMNHHAAFKSISQLKNYSAWQQSALIGLSKKLGVKTKFFKATKLQLLYDFLSRQHVPVSQPLLFRVGYSF